MVVELNSNNILAALPSEPSTASAQANPFETPLVGASPFDAQPHSVVTETMPPMVSSISPGDIMLPDDCTYGDVAPSREDLLLRAAELGPPRGTWGSIVLAPTDPILGAKMQPRVAERRARFRTIVKVALSACLAFCVVATTATALSSSPVRTTTTSGASKPHVPAVSVVPVERLDQATRTKAASHTIAAVRPMSVMKKRH